MALATIDEAAYGKLLARTLPRVIKTEEENERMIAELERHDTRGRGLISGGGGSCRTDDASGSTAST